MNLIYKEYIKFLRDVTGKELADIKEGYFWLDKQIIKGFDKYGNIHKFYRVVISNDLSTVELKKLKDYDNVEDVIRAEAETDDIQITAEEEHGNKAMYCFNTGNDFGIAVFNH